MNRMEGLIELVGQGASFHGVLLEPRIVHNIEASHYAFLSELLGWYWGKAASFLLSL